MKRVLAESVLIIFFAIIIGSMVNIFRPDGIPFVGEWSAPSDNDSAQITKISIEDAYRMWQTEKPVFVDARTPRDYNIDRIPGAVNLPWGIEWQYIDNFKDKIPVDAKLVIYCYSEDCDDSRKIASILVKNNYRNIYIFNEGILGWDLNQYPLEKGSAK